MRRVGNALAALTTRWLPDAFVFAIILSVIVYLMGWGLTDHGPLQLIEDWYTGFWGLLQFAMQMSLVLVTGYALASSGPARRGITKLASLPTGYKSAALLTAAGAMLLGIVHWGLGLIAGALLAIEISKSCKARGIKVHFPLLAAAGYLGLMVWHSGLSGSAPLLVNTPGHFLEDQIGQLPLSETIFQPFNVVFLVVVLVGAPLLIMSMHPKGTEVQEIDLDPSDSGASDAPTGGTGPASREGGTGTSVATESRAVTAQRGPAERLMHSRIPVAVVVIAGFVYLIPELVREGLVGLDLNLLNFTFLMVGLALHGTLASYANAAADGARSAAAVIVQFPLYAGIMGIMEHSGLLQVIADWFVAISTSFSFPFFAMLSAALVNLAVPSGGGQWAVQGPVMVEAAQSLGVENGTAVMAVAMGDQLTNGVQPFWALPLLALTRLRAGQVLGYTAVVMLFAFVVAALCITFLS